MSDSAPKADAPQGGEAGKSWPWLELIKVMALPLVTLVLGYWFNVSLNEYQQRESNSRLFIEMMGRREEADSTLRKDMFNSILTTFMSRDPALRLTSEEVIRQQILSLELLAYNFHDSLDIGPLFKDVERRIAGEDRATNAELRTRLESVAGQVIEHQLMSLSDVGMVDRGYTSPGKIKDFQAHLTFLNRALPNPKVNPGEGTARLCLSMETLGGARRYRQFTLEPVDLAPADREVLMHLFVSKPLTAEECKQLALDIDGNKEIDTNFKVGLFDFPMIDNTRLSGGERVTVSLTSLTPEVLSVALAYFPESRASLKDRPFFDDVARQLAPTRTTEPAPAR